MKIAPFLVLSLLVSIPVAAQKTEMQKLMDEKVEKVVFELSRARVANRNAADQEFDVRRRAELFALVLAVKNYRKVAVAETEEARLDKQVGGGDSNAGGTSLVSRGSIPSIVGLAVENGALTQTTSGTTITFRGNPVGLIKALGKAGFVESYDRDDTATQFLRRMSFGISFDTDRGAQPGTFTADQQQLSSYSFRYDILNHRDPRHKSYKSKWDDLAAKEGVAVASALGKVFDRLSADKIFDDWMKSAKLAINASSDAEMETKVRTEIEKLSTLSLGSDAEELINSFIKSYSSYLQEHDQVLQAAANGSTITFEYLNQRELNAVDLSTFKVIGALTPQGKVNLTFNGSVTVLNKIPAGVAINRLRDFQLSGQADIPLGAGLKTGSFVLSFSGKYQKLQDDVMLPTGSTAPGTSGGIGVGQVKLTIPVAKGTGVKIPLSVTFSNRTELIQEREVRGNIRITLDLDSIFARFKP